MPGKTFLLLWNFVLSALRGRMYPVWDASAMHICPGWRALRSGSGRTAGCFRLRTEERGRMADAEINLRIGGKQQQRNGRLAMIEGALVLEGGPPPVQRNHRRQDRHAARCRCGADNLRLLSLFKIFRPSRPIFLCERRVGRIAERHELYFRAGGQEPGYQPAVYQ